VGFLKATRNFQSEIKFKFLKHENDTRDFHNPVDSSSFDAGNGDRQLPPKLISTLKKKQTRETLKRCAHTNLIGTLVTRNPKTKTEL